MSYQFLIVGDVDKLLFESDIPLELNQELEYEMGLLYFASYNTIFNVTDKMINFMIADKEIKFEPGAYEVKALSDKLTKYGIKLIADDSTAKCKMIIGDTKLKFDDKSFFHLVLGFDFKKTYEKGEYYSDGKIDINSINTINIICNEVHGTFINNNRANLLYSIPTNTVIFGGKIIERPAFPTYFKLKTKSIDKLKFNIVDENLKGIDFNGEKISLLIHIRKCQ